MRQLLVRQTSACFLEGVVPPRKEVVKDKASASKHLVDQRRLLLRRVNAKAKSFMMQHASIYLFW